MSSGNIVAQIQFNVKVIPEIIIPKFFQQIVYTTGFAEVLRNISFFGITLARKSTAKTLKIRQLFGIDLSDIFIVHLPSGIINCFVCRFRILVYLAVTDTFKASGFFKPGPEPADPCEDIKETNQGHHRPFCIFDFVGWV